MKQFRKLKSLKFLYEIDNKGNIRNIKSKHYLKWDTSSGYARVDVLGKHIPIHKLVVEAWIGEVPNGYEIDHTDRNKLNNSVDNLRIVTHSDNLKNRDNTNIIKAVINNNRCEKMIEYQNSDKCKQHMKDIQKLVPRTKGIHYATKKVIREDVKTHVKTIYESTFDAATHIKEEHKSEGSIETIQTSINRCCCGNRKCAYKSYWKYYNL